MLRILILIGCAVAIMAQGYGAPSVPSAGFPQGVGYHGHWDSGSSEEDKKCERCRNIRKDCDGEEDCIYPRIHYFHDHGCKKAIVSCPTKKFAYLTTSDGEVLMQGVNGDKMVKCHKHKKWSAKEINGQKIEFKSLRCIVPKPNANED